MINYDQARELDGARRHRSHPVWLTCEGERSTMRSSFWMKPRTRRSAQMKMFLTRMGERSKMVVSGDASPSRILPGGVTSGSQRRLAGDCAKLDATSASFTSQCVRYRSSPFGAKNCPGIRRSSDGATSGRTICQSAQQRLGMRMTSGCNDCGPLPSTWPDKLRDGCGFDPPRHEWCKQTNRIAARNGSNHLGIPKPRFRAMVEFGATKRTGAIRIWHRLLLAAGFAAGASVKPGNRRLPTVADRFRTVTLISMVSFEVEDEEATRREARPRKRQIRAGGDVLSQERSQPLSQLTRCDAEGLSCSKSSGCQFV